MRRKADLDHATRFTAPQFEIRSRSSHKFAYGKPCGSALVEDRAFARAVADFDRQIAATTLYAREPLQFAAT